MVRIRLTRIGRKNAPAYRIVVTDKKSKVNGKFIEVIGNYNPTEDTKKIVYKKDRFDYWTSVGAQPSTAIIKLIKGTYEFKPYDPKGKRASAEAKKSETAQITDSVSNENSEQETK